jgi:glycosyltransferase involved in cell wall biosynthesis
MITVAMITRNEEGAVGKVVRDIKAAVPDAEVLIVDSSTDRTAEIAEEAGAKVIRQVPARGYGPAMELALRSASGDVVVTLDCDDTYPTDQIAPLAEYVLSGQYDLVDASRLRSTPVAMPWINYLGNWGFACLASIVFGRRFTDLHSGMRAYSKKLLDELSFDPRPPALPVELLLLPVRKGKRLKTVFIDYRERIGQSKMEPIRGAWWTLRRILRARLA